MKETEHDYGLMLTVYSIAINVILIVALGFILWHSLVRSEFNAGFVACRNNMGLIEIAGAGDNTKQGRGK
jgi:hypothetical protein